MGGVRIVDGDCLAISLAGGYHEEEVLDMKDDDDHCHPDVHIETAHFKYLILLLRVFGVRPASHVL